MTEADTQLEATITELVHGCIQEANAQQGAQIPLEQGRAAPILADGRRIDSMGLVSLLLMIEQDLADATGVSLDLSAGVADAAAAGHAPLASVGSLVDHISAALKDAAA